MTRINTNVASLRGLRSLNRANGLLDNSLTRLSTGLKINSGKDNPSGLIASETLRSQVSAIEQSIKNSNRANNVITTAEAALGEVSGLLNQVRGLIQEGLNDGALSQDEIEANQLQIDAALSAINKISANTSFAGDKLIDGSKAFTTNLTSADAAELSDFKINEAIFGSASTVQVKGTVNGVAQKGELRYSGGNFTSAATIEVSGSKGGQVLFFGANSDIADVKSAVNDVSDITGVSASITTATVAGSNSINGTGGLTFTEKRTTANTIAVKTVNATSSSGSSVLSISTTSGVTTITVELADDGTNVTTSATALASVLTNNTSVAALISVGIDAAASVGVASVNLSNGKVLGTLSLTSTDFGSSEFVDINVLTGSFATTDTASNATGRDAGTDIDVTINGQQAKGKGLQASVKTASLDASLNFTSAANVVGTVSTVTITGGGALFQIGQDVSVAGQVGIGIEAVNTARLGGVSGKLFELGANGGKSLLDVGPGKVQGSTLVNIVEEAISRVSTVRGRLGALQKNVIETNINTLGVALENIAEARSQIVDTDFAEETANLTQAQILSQAGISTLAIANQNPQQVLSLLG